MDFGSFKISPNYYARYKGVDISKKMSVEKPSSFSLRSEVDNFHQYNNSKQVDCNNKILNEPLSSGLKES